MAAERFDEGNKPIKNIHKRWNAELLKRHRVRGYKPIASKRELRTVFFSGIIQTRNFTSNEFECDVTVMASANDEGVRCQRCNALVGSNTPDKDRTQCSEGVCRRGRHLQ